MAAGADPAPGRLGKRDARLRSARGPEVTNARGLYDMLGNVFEWCQERFGPYEAASAVDPRGAFGGQFRVFRGGAWISGVDACRISARRCHREDCRGNHLGFRLVRNP